MNLLDGLDYYKKDPDFWQLTRDNEGSAQQVLALISLYGNEPNPSALDKAQTLLISIERWKAMCIKERIGNAVKNSKRAVWEAFRGAVNAQSDLEAILSIMQLKGFGASHDEDTGQRRAKVATAVLRFLKPEDWGVVDWRTIAMLTQLEKSNGDIDQALLQAKRLDPAKLRDLLDIVDEKAACGENQMYRAMRTTPPLSRAADIDMALFGLSLIAWPI